MSSIDGTQTDARPNESDLNGKGLNDMGYITELRKLVGTRPLVMAGACVIVVNDKQEVLLQLRQDNGCWGLAGGALEIGETLVETAKRELREETGLEAEHLELLNVYSGDAFYYKYPHGDEVYNVISAFLCTAYTGEIVRDPSEVAELRFFAIDQLPEKLNPPERPILMEFVQKQQTAHHVSI